MHKKLTFILATLLLLSGCNVASSSNPSSSSLTSDTSTSINNAFQVSRIDLTTQSSTTQFIGLNSLVNIVASVSGSNANGAPLEWYLDGVKSTTQIGNVFEFFPNQAKTYQVQAKFGTIESNTISVNVTLPQFNVSQASAINARSLRVIGEPGISFAISGLTIASASKYNIITGEYELVFISDMTQGVTYNITMNKQGYQQRVLQYTYDSRELKVVSFTLSSLALKADTDGGYSITKPFGNDANKTYQLRLSHKNLEGTAVTYNLTTNGPSGATGSLVTPEQKTISLTKDQEITTATFSVTKDATVGSYFHNINVGGKTLTIKVNIVEAVQFVKLTSEFVYGPAGNPGGSPSHNTSLFTTPDDDDAERLKYQVDPLADGSYIITRPYNGPIQEFSFKLSGDFFKSTNDQNTNVVLMAVEGPLAGSPPNYVASNILPNFTNTPYSRSFGPYTITQYVDANTTLGTYRYVVTAGSFNTPGGIVNRTITVTIREALPVLDTLIVVNGATIKPQTGTNRYVIQKPIAGIDFGYSISMVVKNYESPRNFATQNATVYYTSNLNAGNANQTRYLLNYSMRYSGPLVGITDINSKVAVELGVPTTQYDAITDNTTRTPSSGLNETKKTADVNSINEAALPQAQGGGQPAYTRIISKSSVVQYEIASGVINAAYVPGEHIYTLTVGALTRQYILQIGNAVPKIFVLESEVRFGTVANNSDITTPNPGTVAEYDEDDDTYYIDGVNKYLDLNAALAGVGPSNDALPYTFMVTTPSGAFTSNTNFVTLTLDTASPGSNKFYGTLKFPTSGPGSEMQQPYLLVDEGLYIFSFNVNGATKSIRVFVRPAPQIKVLDVLYGGASLPVFNNRYMILKNAAAQVVRIKAEPINIADGSKFNVEVSSNNTNGSYGSGTTVAVIQTVDGELFFELTLPGETITDAALTRHFRINVYTDASSSTDYPGALKTIIRIETQPVFSPTA